MEDFQLLIDLHKRAKRQGPGGDTETKKILGLTMIDTAASKIAVLEKNGYSPIGYFVLPEHCWLDNYYRPMQSSFAEFLNRNDNCEEAQAIVNAEKNEIALYEKYKAYYGYGVYIARKIR